MTNTQAAERQAAQQCIKQELIEALETMLRQFTKTPSTLKDSEARVKAHAVLARAKGKQ